MSYEVNDLLGAGKFALGRLTYSDWLPGSRSARLILPVMFENRLSTTAVLDTGSPWCILSPHEADVLNIHQTDKLETESLLLRGVRYTGGLYRLAIALPAEIGTGLDVDATVFIPQLLADEEWRHPNFLGLDGFLYRFRFALDPEHNHFYFAPTSEP